MKIKDLSGKKLSHRRSNFPSALGSLHVGAQQRMLEFQPKQMIAFAVYYANDLCPNVFCALGHGRSGGQRSAGDLERNLRCWPKGAVNGNERAAGGDV